WDNTLITSEKENTLRSTVNGSRYKRLSSPVGFGHKVIKLFEAACVFGDPYIKQAFFVAEFHSRNPVQSCRPAFPYKVQGSCTVVDVRQYCCVIAICHHTVN